jgi:hypothetical protein
MTEQTDRERSPADKLLSIHRRMAAVTEAEVQAALEERDGDGAQRAPGSQSPKSALRRKGRIRGESASTRTG